MTMRITISVAAERELRLSRLAMLLVIAVGFSLATGCRTSVTEQKRDVSVNAPAGGVVRRVLVSEGASVEKDAAIIEIAVQPEDARASQPRNTNGDQALVARAAQANLASAEGEANRTAAELRRIEPLVRRGLASQAELDKARAQSLDARQRLDLAREKARNAEASRSEPPSTMANEEIITVRVPSAGTVRVLSVHAGQQVVAGQLVAMLVSHT